MKRRNHAGHGKYFPKGLTKDDKLSLIGIVVMVILFLGLAVA